MLLMKQGEQGWLQTADNGNHEFARLQWFDDGKGARYRVGQGGAPRLGTYDLLGVAIDDRGAHLQWSRGRYSFIPATWYQLSWR